MMKPIQETITGKEDFGSLTTPYQSLVQFYRAFNSSDMRLMSENWLQSSDIAMSNPLGGIKRGWEDIRSVYERIFNGPAEVYVEYFDYTIHETAETYCAVGRERGYFRLNGEEITLAIRTSRMFEKADGLWKQVHHHGSIEDAELLSKYQGAVMGEKT